MLRIRVSLASGVAAGGGLTTFYATPGTEDATSAQAAVDKVRDFFAALTTGFTSLLGWTVSGQVDRMDTTGLLTGSIGVTSRAGFATGSGAAVGLPLQVLCRLSTSSFVAGRRLQGHVFLPGALQASSTATGPAGLAVGQAQAAITALLAAPSASMAIWSRAHQVAGGITSGTVPSSWSVLRSRRD